MCRSIEQRGHHVIGTAVRLVASWWLVEFASGAAAEWRAISADRRAEAERRSDVPGPVRATVPVAPRELVSTGRVG
jgi:hypothetical protein